jgi:predicted secreted Zn-dependent protease
MTQTEFLKDVEDTLYRIYDIQRLKPDAKAHVVAYYARNQYDYDALAYGARDCRLSRFLHNRIVPMTRDQSTA